MRLAATRSSTSCGSGAPADAGAVCAPASGGGRKIPVATSPAPVVRNRRRPVPYMATPPRSVSKGDPVLREVDRLGEPHVLLPEHVLDEPLEHAHPRRPTHD